MTCTYTQLVPTSYCSLKHKVQQTTSLTDQAQLPFDVIVCKRNLDSSGYVFASKFKLKKQIDLSNFKILLVFEGCHQDCRGKCWGRTELDCQKKNRQCHQKCRNSCYGPKSSHCCFSDCKFGCSEPNKADCFKVSLNTLL